MTTGREPSAPAEHPPRDRVLVFVDDLEGPELDDADRRHLERSLRLRSGSPLTVGDGAGNWRLARLGAQVKVDGPVMTAPVRSRDLVVGYAPVKGDRSDLIVQKATELGVTVITPLITERSVVRWDTDRAARQLERQRRIVREAAMQSRNARPPCLDPPQDLDQFMTRWPGALLADPDGERNPDALADHGVVAIGPEGGFSPAERSGRMLVRLPGRILRTETAAITAAALLVAGCER